MSLRIAFDLDGVLADMESELVRQAEALFGEAVARRVKERAEVEPLEEPAAAAAGNSADPGSARQESAEARPESVEAHEEAGGAGQASPPAPGEGSADDEPALITVDLTPRQQRRLWRHVQSIENFWESLPELEPGVVARLAAVATDRRWELMFLTRRPETVGATAQVQTQRWLEAKGFSLPSVYVVQHSRGRIASAFSLDMVVDDTPENCLDVVVDSKARAILVWRGDEKLVPTAARRLGIGVVPSVNACLEILTEIDSPDPDRPGVVDRVLRLLGLKEPASAQ